MMPGLAIGKTCSLRFGTAICPLHVICKAICRINWAKLGQAEPSWAKLSQAEPIWAKLNQAESSWAKLSQAEPSQVWMSFEGQEEKGKKDEMKGQNP